ncbi:MAG: pectin acetylesterase-family hydrolase [Myxococcota bacterium]
MKPRHLPWIPFLYATALALGCDASATPTSATGFPDAGGGGGGGIDGGSSDADSDGGEDDAGDPPVADGPFQELYDQGIDRYLGVFTPATSEARGNSTLHTFRGEGGPVCYTGQEFFMSTRDGSSDALLIFLQGGGACGPNSCDAIEQWPPFIPTFGFLDPEHPGTPVADYDLGYLPYCDGSVWSGDAEIDVDGDGTVDRSHRGVQNLSASLDVLVATYPSPSRIVLAGNSAGGMGTIYALPLVRRVYPDVPIEVINDSGVGISTPGTQLQLNEYWNSGAFFAESCMDCIGEDGHLTGQQIWQLNQDPDVRMGFLSSRQDATLVASLGVSGEFYEAAVLEAMAELEAAHPDRFRSLVAGDDTHTFLLREYDRNIGGQVIKNWVGAMLDGSGWISAAD